MRFLVEIEQHPVIPVTVVADNEDEALEKVLLQKGEAGDVYYRDPTFEIKPLED